MAQQQGGRIRSLAEAEQAGIGQQREAGGPGETFAGQQVAIAADEEYRDTRVRHGPEGGAHPLIETVVEIVVTRPVFEQVAEDEQAGGLECRPLQELDEGCGGVGRVLGQVQVRNEQCRQPRM